MKVLLAAKDETLAKKASLLLKRNKFTVDLVRGDTAVLEYTAQESYAVIVLEHAAFDPDPVQLIRSLRLGKITAPILLLTTEKEMEKRVEALEAGADDCLSLPIAPEEFLANVRALARRSGSYAEELLQAGNLTLDCCRYRLCAGSQELPLNNKEFQLMVLFMMHPGFVYSSGHLMESVWGSDCESDPSVVWTYIGFLRKKMRQLGAGPKIRTIRGAGYVLQ